jgi:Tol biopolymer transport system component
MNTIKVSVSRSLLGILILAVSLGLILAASAQQSAEEMYEAAIFKKDADGDMEGAIRIFREIVDRFPNNVDISAKAQLQIGICYEKLGQKNTKQAQEAFQKVIDNFPTQSAEVKIAREKLSIILGAKKDAQKGAAEFKIRKVASQKGNVSPDGRFLSFADWSTGNGELAVMEIATGKKRCLTHKAPGDESWHFLIGSIFSPDGKKIAFIRWSDENTTDFRMINVDGTGERILLSKEDVNHFWPTDWTKDGKYILGELRKSDKKNHIAFVSAVDGSLRIIKEFDKRSPGKLSLSSDGRWIAYDFPQDEKSDKRNIFLLSDDGKREIPLFKHPADDRLLGWSPGGDWILFSSDRSGTWDAWIIPVSDGKVKGDPILVKQDFGQMEGTRFSPLGFTQDGSFYFGDQVFLMDIYAAEIDTEKTKILSPPKKMAQRFEGSNCDPLWSPDGLFLAYLSDREHKGLKSSAICIMNMDSGVELELLPEVKNPWGLRWFPDGKSFLVAGTDENGQKGLFRVNLKTADMSLIVTGDSGYHSPICSPGGKKVFYDADLWKEKIFRIMRYDLDTQQKKEIYRSDWQIFRMDISPDGKQLVFYEGKDDALKIISVDGGQPRVLLKLEDGAVNSMAWSADGRDVFFSKTLEGTKNGKCELWRIPIEGGKPEKFDLAVDGLIDLNIHPEGSLLAFTLLHVADEVWVMENFLPKK